MRHPRGRRTGGGGGAFTRCHGVVPTARFKDFNFKLVVIEQLMYVDEKLTPQFSLAGLLKEKGLGDDTWEYAQKHDLAYRVVSEARAYLESLELGDELLAGVEELRVDGGNRVYRKCAPVWDGEDGLFDVTSLEDLALLPNLRRVLGSELLGPDLAGVLESRDIAADQGLPGGSC
ncbi:DUF6892 domain-containing protein [Streptomyces sp. KMM 9044]|uniref:DUF6892 domain-containing protein n=1 Tax=Streptomyces sp. KMM 9044 TaxID=2744474 RepID=UPI0021509857|nr:hypothetical protein [Streptomyces sp. KMM 9044]WAX81645.1 hypothetical protein HUV60_032585 [Streptomyces sp. KMM 9044]